MLVLTRCVNPSSSVVFSLSAYKVSDCRKNDFTWQFVSMEPYLFSPIYFIDRFYLKHSLKNCLQNSAEKG